MSDKDFLSRWSERKRDATREEAAEPAPVQPQAEPVPEKTDAEILADHQLKDPDDLEPGDDVRGYLAASIPTHLKNRALRKLWTSNPTLANLDALVEYGEDYTDAANVIENLQTVYEVGKGMVRKVAEVEEKLDEIVADTPAEADEKPVEATATDQAPETPEVPDTIAEPVEETDEPATPRPQRMAFTFPDD